MVSRPRKQYVPERGDLVWLQFDPHSGHEQSGHRPALVLSPQAYNALTGLAVMCPVTSKIKGYPFEVEVPVPSKRKIPGAILSDQVKSLDWKVRRATFIASAPAEVLDDVLAKLQSLIGSV